MASKVSVTWEDQQNINKFSNLYSKMSDLEQQVTDQKKLLDDLEDASNELMLADDDEVVRMKVGECFWGTEKLAAEEQIEQRTADAKQQLDQLQQHVTDNMQALGELRTKLYAKLGDSINLDLPYSSVVKA